MAGQMVTAAKQKGMTSAQIADAISKKTGAAVTPQVVDAYEKGEIPLPEGEVGQAILAVLQELAGAPAGPPGQAGPPGAPPMPGGGPPRPPARPAGQALPMGPMQKAGRM